MAAIALEDAPREALVQALPAALVEAWCARSLVPYLGPGLLGLIPACPVPARPQDLVARLVAKASVPHKIRGRLTQAAQFIENFKHRKTLVGLMREAFAAPVEPSALHRALARLAPPLVVDTWYDGAMAAALAESLLPAEWGQVQGLAQSEHFGTWTGWYGADGESRAQADPRWSTVLYKPLGSVAPAANFLVSDSDFVEVLTEIDIQTPIPDAVKALRTDRPFLFLGCRFDDQLTRSFARQVSKRSSAAHWALLPDAPTRMESRFLEEQGIERIAMPLESFLPALEAALQQ